MLLPEFGVRRPITNLMIFSAVLVLAFYSLSRLGVDLMPEIEPPVISVVASYPGANPEDVEVKVTEVLENQLVTTPGIEKITSRSLEGISIISLKFAWGTNLDTASNDIRDRIEQAKRLLPDIPDEMDNPFIFKFNTAMIPILFVGVTATHSYPELYDLIDDRICDPLRQIPGVGTVQLLGGLERQINVWINRERLEGYGFSVLDIQNALCQENISQPLGSIKSGLTDYLLRLPGEFSSPDELNSVILGKRDGKIVYLKDVARIEDGFKEIRMHVRHNRQPGLMLMVQKQIGVNTVAVARRVKKSLMHLQKVLPADVKMYIIFDTSQDILNTLNTLKTTIRQAIIFVILVVWFFLRKIRSSLVVVLSIPFSLLIAFIFLFLSNRTINVVSLSSLIIASGMVVDNAIVVVDNFLRHLEKGKRVFEAAIFGTSEIFSAIIASTLTTVAVFLPMLLIGKSIIGLMFGELAIIITITLLASLFIATTFIPMLCARLFRNYNPQTDNQERFFNKFYKLAEKIIKSAEGFYAEALSFCLRYRKLIILGFSLIFILSFFFIPLIGNEFMPEQDTGDLRATVNLPLGTRLEETDKITKRIEDILEKEVPEKRLMFVRAGTAPTGVRAISASGESGEHVVMAGLKLIPKSERKRSVFEIGDLLRKRLRALPGVIKVGMSLGNPLGRMITGMGGKAIQLEIIGHSIEETQRLAENIKEKIEKIPGAVDVSISRDINLPELRIAVDREKLANMGLNMNLVASTIRTFIEGATATKYREKGQTYDIYVRLEESSRTKIEDIENLSILSPLAGKVIRLSNFAKVYEVSGPVEIERVNQERVVRVECNVFGRSAGKVKEEIMQALSQIIIPSQIRINFGGEIEEQAKAFRDLGIMLILGVILVYMVMAAQFESLLNPFIVMFSVPFTFSGVFLGLFLTNTTLNIISFLGMIMLMGIVVNNAIVLISYINILRARGYALLEAVTLGGRERLRPLLMTTLTTLAGLLPMAISTGEGSEIWKPLGITMISGLSVSSLITLLFVPTLYTVVEARMRKTNIRKTNNR
ncbi:MAG: efflux RND transporter permease subunit [Candidatus Omnitrophica bacterium]|nr:efflux RND transporter permease subunit [Candidatus Omnitrophota bacterium]